MYLQDHQPIFQPHHHQYLPLLQKKKNTNFQIQNEQKKLPNRRTLVKHHKRSTILSFHSRQQSKLTSKALKKKKKKIQNFKAIKQLFQRGESNSQAFVSSKEFGMNQTKAWLTDYITHAVACYRNQDQQLINFIFLIVKCQFCEKYYIRSSITAKFWLSLCILQKLIHHL